MCHILNQDSPHPRPPAPHPTFPPPVPISCASGVVGQQLGRGASKGRAGGLAQNNGLCCCVQEPVEGGREGGRKGEGKSEREREKEGEKERVVLMTE